MTPTNSLGWRAFARTPASHDDPNCNTSRETSHATAKPSSEGRVARVRSIAVWGGSLNGGAEEYSDDEPVDTEHPSHNDRNDGLHDHVSVENTHVSHPNT